MEPVRPPGFLTCCAAVARLPVGLVRPPRPDRAFLSRLVNAGPPPGETTVTVRALPQVARPVPTMFVAEGLRNPRRIASAMTAFVVHHPELTFVVDPGICTDVRSRAIAELPLALRVLAKLPTDVLDTRESLRQAGIDPAQLAFALPTHLHWDHVAGLLDLPRLPVQIHAVEHDWAMTGEVAPVGGVRSAVRSRPTDLYELDGPPVLTFERSHDLFGDGSVTLVDLAGHTPGSVGVLLRTPAGYVLLAGDAAWHGVQVEHLRPKASYPGRLADADRAATFGSLHRLHAIRETVRVVPTHDHDAALALNRAMDAV
jgi:glyoxylase-like metal-dependent hydrolase (beta-lactamase superfamily II)